MNKNFFPIMGVVMVLIGTSEQARTTVSSSQCPTPYNTECLPVIFHNQSMTLLPPSPNNRQGLKPLAVHEYTMTQSYVKITPVYDYPNIGQASKIDLHNMGDAIFQFDLVDEPLGYYIIEASGIFTPKFSSSTGYTKARWKCVAIETSLKTPSTSKERVHYEVNVKIPNFFEYGVCNYLGPNNFSCTCEFDVTPTLQNLKRK